MRKTKSIEEDFQPLQSLAYLRVISEYFQSAWSGCCRSFLVVQSAWKQSRIYMIISPLNTYFWKMLSTTGHFAGVTLWWIMFFYRMARDGNRNRIRSASHLSSRVKLGRPQESARNGHSRNYVGCWEVAKLAINSSVLPFIFVQNSLPTSRCVWI